MPILAAQIDTLPGDLLDEGYQQGNADSAWWVLQLRPRTEKKLMSRLTRQGVRFHCPLFEKQYRSPAGRSRTSYLPVFNGYVFLFGGWDDRHFAYRTDYVARDQQVTRRDEFLRDLRQIRGALKSGVPLLQEPRLEEGQKVLVRSGPFMGYRGTVIRRQGETRLVLTVDFIEQGISMTIDESQLEPLPTPPPVLPPVPPSP